MLNFALLQWATMFSFGLMGSNFGSMAMENVGAIAGTASSVQERQWASSAESKKFSITRNPFWR